jgi:Xaa-Pro aminopeptidase
MVANPLHQLPERSAPTKELMKYLPQLSLAERDRRWASARQRMATAGIDALLLIGHDTFWDMGMVNLRYLTHIGSKMGAYALFFMDEDPIVWNTNLPHIQRPTNIHLSTQEWVHDIRMGAGIPAAAAELRARGYEKARIGLVSFSSAIMTMPTILHGEMVALQRELPNATLVQADWLVEQMRLVKSEEEIAMLRKASEIARKVVQTMIDCARPGVTEAELYAEIVKTQIANGAEPLVFHLLASGPVEHPRTEIWHLIHGAEQPAVPSRRPLQHGDVVISEFHTCYGGYLSATEFTVYVGDKAPGGLKEIHKVCVETLQSALEVMKAGMPLQQVWEGIRRPAEKAGMDFVELGFHGHGMVSPEFPTVVYRPGEGPPSMNGSRIGKLELQEGMVFGTNIDMFDPRWRPDVGCMFGDTVVVRKNGGEQLVHVPRELPQVG